MGIPYIFGHFTKKYHNLICKNLENCDRLFLDFNSIIHTESQKIIKKSGEIKNNDELENLIFQSIIDHTLFLTTICKPKHLLYIAVDGIAPLAKQNQQRRRRYLSRFRNDQISKAKFDLNIKYVEFDSNAISPGTKFMNKLDKFLKSYFSKSKEIELEFKVEISGHDCLGEGEHKIINLIKNSDIDYFTDVIYGLDADLIMLSLSCKHHNNIYLMRETSFFNFSKTPENDFSYLKIENLKKCILKEMVREVGDKKEMDNMFYIYDYIFVCIWVGNDFIPGITFFKIKNSAIEVLCDKYRTIHDEIREHFVYQDSFGKFKINKLFLEKFLIALGEIENSMMISVTRNYYQAQSNIKQNINNSNRLQQLIVEIDNYPLYHRFPCVIDPENDPQWRDHYYNVLFGENLQETVKYICVNWLQGLMWTLNYYFNRKFKFDWYYKWNFAPCITDLTNYCITIENDYFDTMQKELSNCTRDINEWSSGLQLMMVLPPQSIDLIPNELRRIMSDIDMNCVHYYPHKFKINTYLKQFLWECTPILPNININNLQKSYYQLQIPLKE